MTDWWNEDKTVVFCLLASWLQSIASPLIDWHRLLLLLQIFAAFQWHSGADHRLHQVHAGLSGICLKVVFHSLRAVRILNDDAVRAHGSLYCRRRALSAVMCACACCKRKKCLALMQDQIGLHLPWSLLCSLRNAVFNSHDSRCMTSWLIEVNECWLPLLHLLMHASLWTPLLMYCSWKWELRYHRTPHKANFQPCKLKSATQCIVTAVKEVHVLPWFFCVLTCVNWDISFCRWTLWCSMCELLCFRQLIRTRHLRSDDYFLNDQT